ncbi:Uncharacterised protein [Mycobacteroides abscessus subsp. abscessus]|nr:Uncharacterised protein [Mycobacteroides abscessus subsp. abscessus]
MTAVPGGCGVAEDRQVQVVLHATGVSGDRATAALVHAIGHRGSVVSLRDDPANLPGLRV